MAYVGIGNRQDYVADFQSQNFSGDGSTTAFTLNYEAVTGSIRVAVDNVLQPADGSSYTVDGFTLNFDSAPASGTNNITVLFLGTVRNISSVSDGAIVASKLASNAVETAKINDGAVTYAKTDGNFGKVLQVVQTTSTTLASTTSTSFADTNCTATITPSSTSSTIIGIAMGFALKESTIQEGQYTVFRDATDLTSGGNYWSLSGDSGSTTTTYIPCTISFQDAPSTTGATVYKIKMKMGNTPGTVYFYRKQFMTLMEIAG